MTRPNIIFMHSHNTGQSVQPYGHAVPTPNLQRLAAEGVLFRRAYASAPTCSPSRASFLSGMAPHSCGMVGLAHRGFSMHDYSQHIVQVLKRHGYYTALSGVEHTAPDLRAVGYDAILSGLDTNYPTNANQRDIGDAAAEFLHNAPNEPFFLSIGLNETHRPFPKADPQLSPAEDARYTLPLAPFPDTPETRADAADFKAAARVMDASFGKVLDALEQTGLAARTLLFCFSDHGLQFPQHMCNLTDRGMAVYLIIRGPDRPKGEANGFLGGRVVDEMVSLIDLAPTAYQAASIEVPNFVQGKALQPLLSNGASAAEPLHDAVFAEVNYHAAYEPMRCVRTERFKYIRRYDGREKLVLPNVDDTPSKEFLLQHGWENQPREQEMLYDLLFDPLESNNLIDNTEWRNTAAQMRERLDQWMAETDDPIVEEGQVCAPSGSLINDPNGLSPRESTLTVA